MNFDYSIKFRTPYVLGQDTAMAFWEVGESFAASGPRTYVFTGGVTGSDALAAGEHAVDLVEAILAKASAIQPDSIEVLALSVTLVES